MINTHEVKELSNKELSVICLDQAKAILKLQEQVGTLLNVQEKLIKAVGTVNERTIK